MSVNGRGEAASFRRHSGARRSREPGIHNHERKREPGSTRLPVPWPVVMDSGFGAARRPGMTAERVLREACRLCGAAPWRVEDARDRAYGAAALPAHESVNPTS